jgi:hypothetical protein
MSRKIMVFGALGVFVILCLSGLWVFGAKPAPKIELRASFLGLTDPQYSGYDYFVNKIFNDDQGAYVTTGNNAVEVYFTSDKGELFFKIEHHADRSVNVVFPYALGPCGYLPDTVGIYPDLPDETVDFFRFKTYNSSAYGPPKINFLTMTPGVPQQVRLWTTICTISRHYFILNYNNSNPTNIAGVVEVTAYDDNNDGTLDRWEINPVPGTGDLAWIYKHPENKKDEICPFGAFPMPFKLILERVQ